MRRVASATHTRRRQRDTRPQASLGSEQRDLSLSHFEFALGHNICPQLHHDTPRNTHSSSHVKRPSGALLQTLPDDPCALG